MDKLQWFKFTPTDWIMGKIQRCPEITQARFMRLICLYWNKECELSYEDAEIEIDKEHLDLLINKKIIKLENTFISIEFLNEQMDSIAETSIKRRDSVNKRWEKVRKLKELELQNYTSVSKINTSVLQSDTEKRREEEEKEKTRKEKEKKESDFNLFWNKYNKKLNLKESKKKFLSLRQEQINKIIEVVDNYVLSTPDIKYRKHPTTWLNGECWNDEININLNTIKNGTTKITNTDEFKSLIEGIRSTGQRL